MFVFHDSNISQCFYSSPLFTHIATPLEATVQKDRGLTCASTLRFSFFIASFCRDIQGMPPSFGDSGQRGFVIFSNISRCFYSFPLFIHIVIPLDATVQRDRGSTSASSLCFSFFYCFLLQGHPENAQVIQRVRTKRVYYFLKSFTMFLFISTLHQHSHSPGSYSAQRHRFDICLFSAFIILYCPPLAGTSRECPENQDEEGLLLSQISHDVIIRLYSSLT